MRTGLAVAVGAALALALLVPGAATVRRQPGNLHLAELVSPNRVVQADPQPAQARQVPARRRYSGKQSEVRG